MTIAMLENGSEEIFPAKLYSVAAESAVVCGSVVAARNLLLTQQVQLLNRSGTKQRASMFPYELL